MSSDKNILGAPLLRWEDQRLLTGRGRFTEDHNVHGQAFAKFVRSPHGFAEIVACNIEAAKKVKGVLGVFSADELSRGNVTNLPSDVPERGPLYPNRNGTIMPNPPYFPLARGRVRHVGDAVAVVIAETPESALDASERTEITYNVLPANIDTVLANDPVQIPLWDEVSLNTCFEWEAGNKSATEEAIKCADHQVSLQVIDNRTITCFMEPRAALAQYDNQTKKFTLNIGCQGVHISRNRLAETLRVRPSQIRVISRDVGGGFGSRSFTYPEYAIVLWAARKIGRPIKWVGTRSEEFISTNQGRDYVMRGLLGLSAGGKFLGLKVSGVCNLGGYLAGSSPFTALRNVTRMLPGVYQTPALYLELSGVFTNTVPIASYRGVGRVEAIDTMERLIDEAARKTGFDRLELRRKNFVPPSEMPYTSPLGSTYDSGLYEENFDIALARSKWSNFEVRREKDKKSGLLRGIGLSNYIEGAGGVSTEFGSVYIHGDGIVTLAAGSVSQGQGHETTFRQIVADILGVNFACIEMVESNSDLIVDGVGTNASRSMVRAGMALKEASEKAIKAGIEVAAEILEAAQTDILFTNGKFQITGTDRSVDLFSVAKAFSGTNPQRSAVGELGGESLHKNDAVTYPNGCHVCELIIDSETGFVEILKYTIVDDVGCAVNPMIVKGQSQGAVAQGIGQALMEKTVYDHKTGQLLSGSFMDYAIPLASDLPLLEVTLNEVPSPTNSLGVKGAGEGGTTGAPAAVINAILDALTPLGITSIDMPATPYKIWQTIQKAKPETC